MSFKFLQPFIFSLLVFSNSTIAQKVINIDSLKQRANANAQITDPQGRIKGFYSIDNAGISIFSTPENKIKNHPECKIFWNEIILFRQLVKQLPKEILIKMYQAKNTAKYPDSLYQYPPPPIRLADLLHTPSRPLKGLRIALDPGHVSGDMEMAAYELKYLKLKKDSIAGIHEPIDLIEGNLTLATAFFLKAQLEGAGAEVMITRDKPNYSSYGLTYYEWLKKAKKQFFETAYREGEISLAEKNRFIKLGSPKDIFQNYFRFADLYNRAKIINDYQPDFTVIIHYNVDERNKPWTGPTSKNFNMVFVPGDIKPVFLKRVENRFELLRLLASEDINESISFGKSLITSFEKVLEVPTALPHHATYLKDDCEPTPYKGVYVRNLALTRLIHGPVAYGETLYQDNIAECHLLSKLTLEVNGIKTSERVRQVAQAYFEGILNYAFTINKN